MINLKYVPVIQTIIREGSITAASKKLFVSQPSLSQLVRNVETDLGAPLFERSGNRMILTRAGELYLEAAQSIQLIDNNLHAQVAESKNIIYGEFRMGISNQRGLMTLPSIVPKFSEIYPHVKIKLKEEGSSILERMVSDGNCDVAFVSTSEKNNNLNYVLIEKEELVLIANKQTKLAQRFPDGACIDLREAADECFISMNNDHSVRAIQNHLFTQNAMTPTVRIETHNMEAAKAITANSDSVFLLPKVYISDDSPYRAFVNVYSLENISYKRHFYFCYPKSMHLACYHKDLVRLVCEHFHVPYVLDEPEEIEQ